MNKAWEVIQAIIAVSVVLTILFVGLFGGLLVSDDVPVNTMKALGFTEIAVESKSIFLVSLLGCDKNDQVIFYASGKNSNKERVNVIICAGLFKGGTLRVR
jgi:hypothetical protein